MGRINKHIRTNDKKISVTVRITQSDYEYLCRLPPSSISAKIRYLIFRSKTNENK